MDPMTIGLILSAAGLGQNALTKNKVHTQQPGAIGGEATGLGGGPFSVQPPMAPVPEIPVLGAPTGVGEILAGTIGFDPSRPQPGQPGVGQTQQPEGTTLDTSKDKLPQVSTSGNASSAEMTAKDWNEILKSASMALSNPMVQSMLGFASKDRRQSPAPISGGGANPQVLIGNGMQRANVGALLSQIPRG